MRVVTPENIAFEYRLAGPFLRLGAFAIDRLIVLAFLAALALVMAFIPVVQSLILPVLILSWFITMWFYGGLFETYWNGSTPGKSAMGIRVIGLEGRPINAMQAIVRNVLRYADVMPLVPASLFVGVQGGSLPVPIGAIGLLAMMFTHNYRRLGDLVCGTMVVVEQREWAPDVIHVETPEVVEMASRPPDFRASRNLSRAVANYLERRRILTAERRSEIARHLRDALVRRYGIAPYTDPDLLMRAMYYRVFIADRDRDEQYLEQRVVQHRSAAQIGGGVTV